MKFSEIPQRLHALLMPPEPIIINHLIRYVLILQKNHYQYVSKWKKNLNFFVGLKCSD